jgi:mannose-6-phosphate isomerase
METDLNNQFLPQLSFKLDPFKVNKIWGSEKWEVSNLQIGPSFFQGVSLRELSTGKEEFFWGPKKELRYLVKFIETKELLSVQVHPNDYWAQLLEKSTEASGKTECWLILKTHKSLDEDSETGVYLGFKEEHCNLESIQKFIEGKIHYKEVLQFHPVESGDFFYVPAGTVHAIGPNLTLLEIQQSSGITYRMWDYLRKDDFGQYRTLHIAESLKVTEMSTEGNRPENFKITKNVWENNRSKVRSSIGDFLNNNCWIQHKDFKIYFIQLKENEELSFSLIQERGVYSLICLEGELEFDLDHNCKIQTLSEQESLLLPYLGATSIRLKANKNLKLVIVK